MGVVLGVVGAGRCLILRVDPGCASFNRGAFRNGVEQGGTRADALEVVQDEGVGSSDGEVRDDGGEGVRVVRPGCRKCSNVLDGMFDPCSREHVSNGD